MRVLPWPEAAPALHGKEQRCPAPQTTSISWPSYSPPRADATRRRDRVERSLTVVEVFWFDVLLGQRQPVHFVGPKPHHDVVALSRQAVADGPGVIFDREVEIEGRASHSARPTRFPAAASDEEQERGGTADRSAHPTAVASPLRCLDRGGRAAEVKPRALSVAGDRSFGRGRPSSDGTVTPVGMCEACVQPVQRRSSTSHQ